VGTGITEDLGDFNNVRTGLGWYLVYFEEVDAFLVFVLLCHGQLAAEQQT
jgi:hypothetical protein